VKIAIAYSVAPSLHYVTEPGLSFLSVYDVENGRAVHYSLNTVDAPQETPNLGEEIYFVNDKRLFDTYYPSIRAFDIQTQIWLHTNNKVEDLEENSIWRTYRSFYNDIVDWGRYIPSTKYKEISDLYLKQVLPYIETFVADQPSLFYKDKIYPALEQIERAGLYVDLSQFNRSFDKNYAESKVYCRYRLHTTTGRPSNTFDNVNFSALNKQDGSRKSFISRFGSNGLMLEFDLDAYHLRLIGQIIGYELPEESVHEYFGKKYFNTETLTDAQYHESKSISFRLLYGSIPPEYAHVEFFTKVEAFKKKLWDTFYDGGNIYSPISGKYLTRQMFPNITSSKLFNYLLQTVETEYSIIFIEEIQRLLTQKKSKLILYTYDAFLLDYCKEDGTEVIYELADLLKNSRLRVGFNYHDLQSIDLTTLRKARLGRMKDTEYDREKATTTMHVY